MGNAFKKGLGFQILRNPVLRVGNVHIWVVLPCSLVDLLILRNRVFRHRNVQILIVLSWNEVVLLKFRNSVFKLRNVQIWNVTNCKGVYFLISGMRFSGS